MNKLDGLPNVKRDVELSQRMYARNVVDTDVQMYYDPRAVQTRFQRFPCADMRKDINEPLKNTPHFDIRTDFLPGNGGPFEGYAKNVEDESKLKNIRFPHQRGIQSKYIPNTFSDLYVHNIETTQNTNYTQEEHAKHGLLFKEQEIPQINRNPYKIANDRFFNHTRQQVKNL